MTNPFKRGQRVTLNAVGERCWPAGVRPKHVKGGGTVKSVYLDSIIVVFDGTDKPHAMHHSLFSLASD